MDAKEFIWNPYLKGYFDNPRDHLRLWRNHNPVHKGINNGWFLFKYEDVKFLLTSPVFKTWKTHEAVAATTRLQEQEKFDELATVFGKVLLFQDAPIHTQIRSSVTGIWNSFSLQEIIEEAVCESLESLAGKTDIDIVAEYSRVVPTLVISKILGLPAADYARITNWSYRFIAALEPFVSLHQLRIYNQEAAAFHAYLTEVIERKKAAPDHFFISRFLAANESLDEPLSRDGIISILCMLFFAGIETSVNLLSQSILLLLENPAQAALARENERLPPPAAAELIRYISPVNYTKRVAAEDVEIRGKRIRAGESLFGALISANFDEEIFEHSEQLDLTRAANPHIGFGHGAHFCLGARLGREQISRSLPALFRRYPNIALPGAKKYEWDKLIMNRALKSLPARLNG